MTRRSSVLSSAAVFVLVAAMTVPWAATGVVGQQTGVVTTVEAESLQDLTVTAGAPKLSRDSVAAVVGSPSASVGSVAGASALCPVGSKGDVRYPLEWGCTVGSPFGYRFDLVYQTTMLHAGVDFDPGYGAPVLSMADGIVTDVGWFGGYGYRVEISHPDLEVTTLYGHMIDGSAMVTVGQKVSVGDPIGLVGSTGKSTGAHLHFEVRVNGAPVDPIQWLDARISP